MPPKAKVKTFHPVTTTRSLTLSGGYAPSKQFVPETRNFSFTRGGGGRGVDDADLRECVRVGHRESWLCELTTGLAVYHRPLARVRILKELCQLVAGGSEATDKKMASLAFDDGDSDEVETPTKAPRPSRERKKKTTAVAVPELCKIVEVREQPKPGSSTTSVFAALDKQRRLWLHVDSLSWLVEYIRQEKELGGVDPVAEDTDEPQVPRIYWNFRDSNWIARAQAIDGTWLQTSRGVKRKQRAEQLDFVETKKAVYSELEEWMARVAAGEITRVEPEEDE